MFHRHLLNSMLLMLLLVPVVGNDSSDSFSLVSITS